MAELIGNIHIVPLIHPVDTTTAAPTTDIFSMQKFNHACIILQTGTNSKGFAITVENCTTAAGGSNDAMSEFYYREMATTDTWGALTASGGTLTVADGDDQHVFAIEIDADELTAADHYFVKLTCAAPASGNNYVSAIVILSEPRYMQDIPVTAIA
jgi:hypothetical protein